MKLKSLIKKIESKYPLNLAYDWDNVGLIVGDYDSEVKKVLLVLEANEKVIEEAIDNNVDLIITHHPFIFRKMNKINTGDFKGRLIHKLIKNDISLYSMHTNFDIAFDGLNDYFMKLMNIENSDILEETYSQTLYKLVVYVPKTHEEILSKCLGDSKAGHIGNYSHCMFKSSGEGQFKALENTNAYIGEKFEISKVEEVKIETIVPQNILNNVINEMIKVHPYEEVAYDIYRLENKSKSFGLGRISKLESTQTLEEVCNLLKDKLNMKHIRVVGDLNTTIKKVAVVTGSGADMIRKAKNKKADVLITGDVKYHDAQDALDMGICLIDCGHFDSEDIFKDIMNEYLSDIDEIQTIKSEIDLNPFNII